MKLRQSRKRHIASEGKMASHGFCWRIERLSLIMLPHEGVGGLTESPRKARAPSRVTTVAMPIKRNDTPIGATFGRSSFMRIRRSVAPWTFAATT